jgi:periplasmic protein TonB
MRKYLIAFIFLTTTLQLFGQNETNEPSFAIVEETAAFPGGLNKFYQYLSENIVYPKDAKKQKAKGKLYVEFYIMADGSIDQDSVRVLNGSALNEDLPPGLSQTESFLPESCHKEAIRVVKNSPRWNPGKRRGIPIKQKFVLPINFG